MLPVSAWAGEVCLRELSEADAQAQLRALRAEGAEDLATALDFLELFVAPFGSLPLDRLTAFTLEKALVVESGAEGDSLLCAVHKARIGWNRERAAWTTQCAPLALFRQCWS